MDDDAVRSRRHPPWRLRDLSRRGLAAALAVGLVLALPYAAALAQAVSAGWNPSNDDALIALQVHDVLDGEWPLLGQPSTAEHYTGGDTLRHPGPIEFYVLAAPVALLGADLGLPLGAGLINLASVLVAAWVVFRRAGPVLGLAASPLLAALAWAQGPVQLVDPISSNMGGIPMLALAVVAWAVLDGDLRLLPLGALVLAFVAQQHLAVFGMAGGLGAWMALGAGVAVVGWRRARSSDGAPTPRPARDAAALDKPGRWVGAAVAVSLVAWAPVLVDQVAGSGNLGQILGFAGTSDRPSVGFGAGLRQVVRAIGVPPLVLQTDLTGGDLIAPLSILSWLGGLAVAVALAAVAVTDRSRNRSRAALAATVLLLAALGVVTGSNVPDSVEAGRLNLYRWTFTVSILTWVTLGWAVAGAFVRRAGAGLRSVSTERPQLLRFGAGAAAIALVAVTVGAVAGAGPRTWRDEEVFAAEEELSAALLEEVAGLDRLLVVPVGSSAEFAVAPALVVDLVEAGHDFGVPPSQATGYGEHRVLDGGFDGAVVVVSGSGDAQPWPGRLVARVDLNAVTAGARAEIASQVRGRELVVSSRADEVLDDLVDGDDDVAALFAEYLEGLADDPETVLLHPVVGRALRGGYFSSPELNPAAVETLAANPPRENWNEDVIEVRILDREEVEEHLVALMSVGIGRPV